MKDEKIILTAKKMEEAKAKLDWLQNVERPRVIQDLQLARSQGDLSENADYDAAKNRQGEVEAEILELQNMLANAVTADNLSSDTISVTDFVTFKNLGTGEEVTVQLVSGHEVDPLAEPYAKISNGSELGQVLLGQKVDGEALLVEAAKPYEIEILSFHHDK